MIAKAISSSQLWYSVSLILNNPQARELDSELEAGVARILDSEGQFALVRSVPGVIVVEATRNGSNSKSTASCYLSKSSKDFNKVVWNRVKFQTAWVTMGKRVVGFEIACT